jgi:hypothetical protein
MSNWQPVKADDLVRLYRKGWTLKNPSVEIEYNRKNIPFKTNGFLESCLLSDKWLGKPPEKTWVKRYDRESFLVAMAWIENGGCSSTDRLVCRAGGKKGDAICADADGAPVYAETSLVPGFSVADVSAEDWELWQEVEVSE